MLLCHHDVTFPILPIFKDQDVCWCPRLSSLALELKSEFSPRYRLCLIIMSFQLPSNSLSKVDLEASNKSPVYVAVAVGFVLATGSVILRCVARRNSKTSLSWNDYTIFFALVSSLALRSIITCLTPHLARSLWKR